MKEFEPHTVCDDCKQPCEVIMIDDSFDYAGTHCNYGRGGTHHIPPYAGSDCCEASYSDSDSGLLSKRFKRLLRGGARKE